MAYTNTLKKWGRRLAIGVGILVVLVLAASFVVRQVAIHKAEQNFPPPGLLVEFDGRLSHINCFGSGSPIILLESGLDDQGSLGWKSVFDELSKVSRVCAYDRAGIMWSEPREGPRDAVRISNELHMLLQAASEPPPYVIAGHSLAGLFMLTYDKEYPEEIQGFVFVDASHPEQDQRFPEESRQLIEQLKSEPDHRWFFKLAAPYRIFVPERPTPRTAYWWRSFPEGVLREGREINAMSEQAARTDSLGDRPVIVLSAGVPLNMPGISREGNVAMRNVWLELHKELADLSSNSDHRIVEGAGHYIHQDRPEEVVTAVKDVVEALREGKRVRNELRVDGQN